MDEESAATPRRLTTRQMAVVRDLAAGFDVQGVARRQGRSISATYELVNRICERWDLKRWEEIAGVARTHGLLSHPYERDTAGKNPE